MPTNRYSDRALLAKSQPPAHTDWQTGSSLSISPPRPLGRISLPDHVAPAAFPNSRPLEQRLPHRKKASRQCSRATRGQSIADACQSYPLKKILNHKCVSHLCTLVAEQDAHIVFSSICTNSAGTDTGELLSYEYFAVESFLRGQSTAYDQTNPACPPDKE